jgi:hypothetical protein
MLKVLGALATAAALLAGVSALRTDRSDLASSLHS